MPRRVAEMEEKLDGLMALLAQKQADDAATASESSSGASHITAATTPSDTSLQPFAHSLAPSIASSQSFTPSIASSVSGSNLFVQQPLPVFTFANFDPFQDVISRGIVDFSRAEDSIRFFQTKAAHFPFVIIPPKTTLDSLRRERPFLLLSIITFAAVSNEKLQIQLDLEIRESLSKRIIVESEKSLDLLQGLLVYLTWYVFCSREVSVTDVDRYHFYFKMDREQMYQLSQMASAMAVDLGIDRPIDQGAPCDYRIMKARPLVFLPKRSPEELEAQRTFLGAYFVTSS